MTLTAPSPRRSGSYPALRLPNLKRRFVPPSLPRRDAAQRPPRARRI